MLIITFLFYHNRIPQEMIQQRPQSSSTYHTDNIRSSPEDYFIKDFQIKLQSPAISTQYLHSSNYACFGCQDGVTRVLSCTKKIIQYNLVHEDKTPVTCIASSPSTSSIKNTAMVTHSGGTLEYWHATSNQLLFQKKYDTILQSCQISNNCNWYVVSGENGDMLLGHLDKGNPSSLQTGQLGAHANRVFCIKWHPTDINTFFSGGWDKTVFMWDVRTKTSVKSFYGYYIGGQAIDVKGHQLLLGNNRNETHLRIYDFKNEKMRNIAWQQYDKSSLNSITGVNSCSFGKQQGQILALSSRNQLRFFRDQKCLSMFRHFDDKAQGYSMSLSPEDKVLIASWNTGDLKIMAY